MSFQIDCIFLMNSASKWGIALGIGIPTILILIGLIVLITKFITKHCRKKAWDEINVLPTDYLDSSENSTNPLRISKYHQLSTTNNSHISIPIDNQNQHDIHHTINQIQKEFETSVCINSTQNISYFLFNRLKLLQLK